MCERHENRHEHGHGHGRHGRHGFPSRERLLERLQGYRQHLEGELANVQELIGRLGDAPQQPTEV